ncbi:YqzE family protein [Weizmannia coagulans]|jgi:hypothetical protein|uniref:YqzE family protein n=3 Tax=Heyndrickxia TaxID=2837504 RepID=A0A0C5C7M2_HEYCO|nr:MULTISPECIES: YqzE family protein [Heyndrickxia]AEP01998.1 hypothetical protein Bcoa_2822 [Heyndrickxia coagulans 36D1]AJO22619.1 hypothetical protein SB48_HM08orf02884 [Heyndrickxia coagulans]AKN55857.1 hypothetical protein AB434_3452 [Heyndrickxia coagulans]APB36425.1 YqzE family protein [Heyndrickxia coagulans]ATW82903.1 YqzE family protein [Heyndrickxia coagulans]
MSTNDYVKLLTQTWMQHVSTPKSERQKKRNEKKEEMPPFAERWFGILPYFFLFFKRKQ